MEGIGKRIVRMCLGIGGERMNKVKGYRVMCGYTQSEMAEMIGIVRKTYMNKEQEGNWTVKEANAIVEAIKRKIPTIKYEDIFLD